MGKIVAGDAMIEYVDIVRIYLAIMTEMEESVRSHRGMSSRCKAVMLRKIAADTARYSAELADGIN